MEHRTNHKRKKRLARKYVIRRIGAVVVLFIMIMTVVIIVNAASSARRAKANALQATVSGNSVSEPPTPVKTPVQRDKNETKQLQERCAELLSENEELLMLVNKNNPTDSDFKPNLRDICNGRLRASVLVYRPLRSMFSAAEEEGHLYYVASAYRSREYQQTLIDNELEMYLNRGISRRDALREIYKETMPVGCSEHETGLALDILASDNPKMDVSQASEAENVWLCKHCHEFGFILRYPEGMEDITGISYEPWHFRYVGIAAAQLMYEENLTLEEFTEYALAGQTD